MYVTRARARACVCALVIRACAHTRGVACRNVKGSTQLFAKHQIFVDDQEMKFMVSVHEAEAAHDQNPVLRPPRIAFFQYTMLLFIGCGRGVGGDVQATAINPVTSLHARTTRRANTLYTAILAPWWKLYLFRHP